MSTTTDPLDRAQIDLLLSLDDGAGDALAEIVGEYRTVCWQGRDDLRRGLREGDHTAVAGTAHSLKGASANLGANDLAQVCAELEMHARQIELVGSDEFADTDTLMERFEAEFTRVQVALMLLVPEG
ncbi:MAG TPA: Hpt domain-containing protein [Acidimicrobiales bacterium]|jgi:HPt (histidine-containing phosphotransfer) domain-containing protein|nr:Hpt domain-containing protein [Acidimicrobiales bacterium]